MALLPGPCSDYCGTGKGRPLDKGCQSCEKQGLLAHRYRHRIGKYLSAGEAEGLGSCMIGWFDEKTIKKYLGIPASKRVELIITLGYSLGSQREKKRKPREETVSYNKY